jgi:ADP-ribose pyrophosphatase YjhB (NUDIX family)
MDKKNREYQEFLAKGDRLYLRHLSVDCVIFGFHDNKLKVLLLKWKDGGHWCLPGGFIKKNEAVDDAATRILQDRTGLNDIFLRQFHAFGDPYRDRNKELLSIQGKSGKWLMERFITIGYYALVEYSKVHPQADWLSEECKWFDIHKIPKLIYDHGDIVKKALTELQLSLNDQPIGNKLLPEKFTMPELQRLYETLLDKELDRRNFQKKMLSLGILERLKERKTGGAHKAPFLYRFDKKKYEKAMKQGLRFGF